MNLIFDISNIYYRSYFKCKSYLKENDDEENKGILIRKFFIDFSFICNMFTKVDGVICCFDSKSYRKDIDVNYKVGREKKEQYFYDALDEIKYILQTNGFIVLKHKGLEADDLIYLCTELFDNNCIISNDEDIRQYLNEKTYNLVLQKDNNRVYHNIFYSCPSIDILKIEYRSDFIAIDPIDILIKKLFLGCNSDNIPKIAKRGVGESALNKVILQKSIYIQNDDLDFIKMLDIYNTVCKDNVSLDQLSHNNKLVSFNGHFDDSIFQNIKYTFNKDFKMQSILENTKYLTK